MAGDINRRYQSLIYRSPDNPHSYLTAKTRTAPSFPVRHLLSKKLIQGRVLDFGSGHGSDVAHLLSMGIEVEAFDPYYAPDLPSGQYDTILCTYVLNVLLPLEQAHVLMSISEILNPAGSAYYTVRRDIQKSGYRTHAIHQARVYQCNVVLPFSSVLSTNHCEVYRYQPINRVERADSTQCSFCAPDRDLTLITESATAYAIYSPNAVSPGHAIVVPKLHIAHFFDLPDRNKTACWLMVERVKSILDKIFRPTSFTVQFDVNAQASQETAHAHIHLIPQYPSGHYHFG